MMRETKVMRDVFIEELCNRMQSNKKIFFLSADFGSPKLDRLRSDFPDRFINVGIAEQNLINISTGLALEGFTVYAYAIAPFLTMRAYEQIRINLSMLGQLKDLNINLIGVGAGLSYDVSGPTHHCLEDIAIMRALPNLIVASPSDWILAKGLVDYSLSVNKPKYIRLDGKPLAQIYDSKRAPNIKEGFREIRKGDKLCLVSTGYMTHKAIRVSDELAKKGINIGVIDLFLLKSLNDELFYKALKKYRYVITLEEAFINRGGLDSLVNEIIGGNGTKIRLKSMGFRDKYTFDIGSRDYLHKLNKLDEESIVKNIKKALKEK